MEHGVFLQKALCQVSSAHPSSDSTVLTALCRRLSGCPRSVWQRSARRSWQAAQVGRVHEWLRPVDRGRASTLLRLPCPQRGAQNLVFANGRTSLRAGGEPSKFPGSPGLWLRLLCSPASSVPAVPTVPGAGRWGRPTRCSVRPLSDSSSAMPVLGPVSKFQFFFCFSF